MSAGHKVGCQALGTPTGKETLLGLNMRSHCCEVHCDAGDGIQAAALAQEAARAMGTTDKHQAAEMREETTELHAQSAHGCMGSAMSPKLGTLKGLGLGPVHSRDRAEAG